MGFGDTYYPNFDDLSNKKIKKSYKDITEDIYMLKNVGINFNIIGLGHAGSKIAEEFSKLGYNTLAINTSPTDLANIQGPVKLAIHNAGAGKDLSIAKSLFEDNRTKILDTVNRTFSNKEFTILIASLGGGTGSGTIVPMAEALKNVGYENILSMIVLPLDDDGILSMKNSLQTLKDIAIAVQNEIITSIILIDNSKMYNMHPNTSISEFWKIANREIVLPIHTFNTMSTYPTNYTAIDPQDLTVIFTTPGCMTFGMSKLSQFSVKDINEMTAEHFDSGLMASGFDRYSASVHALIITGDANELKKIPKESETKLYELFSSYTHGGKQFKGIYEQKDYPLIIYSIIGGMDLPIDKIKKLKKLSKQEDIIEKKKQFNADLSIFDDEEN